MLVQRISILILIILGYSCSKIDTNSDPIFKEIQNDISNITEENLYWNSSIKDIIKPIAVEQLLQKELTENLVMNITLLNNQTLQSIYENLGIAKAKLAQAGLLNNPIFSLSYEFSTKSNVSDLINTSLLQNFLEILLIPLKKKMAKTELETTKLKIMTNILDIIAKAKIAFYDLQAAQQMWNLKKQIFAANELSYEAAKELYHEGNLRKLDLSMKQNIFEQSKLDLATWETVVLQAREQLNILMGVWGHQINWRISSNFPDIPNSEELFKNIENNAVEHSIDLKIAYNHLLITAASFGIDTSRLIFPKVDIGIGAEREESIWYIGPAFNLALPFFDFGKANSAKAQSTIMKEWNKYTALAVNIRSKARSSRFFLLNAFRQSQYLKKVIIPLAEKITEQTLLQHNAMQLGVFQLLAVKKKELEKKIQYIESKKKYWIFKTELQTLMAGHLLRKNTFENPIKDIYE